MDLISNLSLHRVGSPFDRRVTALEWHPTRPNILGVGSKGGDIILWDVEHVKDDDKFVTGVSRAQPRGQFGRKSLPELADFSLF